MRLPPAISTTESNARIAADAACGVVALESLNQLTPSAVGDRLEAVAAEPGTVASASAMASGPARPVSSTSADAASALVTSCGRPRRIDAISAIRPPGPMSQPSAVW